MGLGHSKQPKRQASESGKEGESGNPPLEVNSMVQITLDKGNQVFGIIRWLGYLPQIKHKMAGVELVRSKKELDSMILVGSFLFGMFYKLIDLGRAACPLGMGRRSCRETLRVCSLSSGAVIEAWGKIIENPTSGVNKYKK